MPNQYARLNLSSALFPFYTEAAGRTIMLPENDENFDRYNAANTTPDKGVPQVFYMHNVMPIAGGFQSIGYTQQLAGIPGAQDFDTCFPIINSFQSTVYFVPADGKNYIFDGNVGAWVSTSPLPPGAVPAGVLVTTAFVQGITYIYYKNYGCFVYNDTTRLLEQVALTGLTDADVVGILGANGYLIAYTRTGVFWSSLSNPTDFIPSIQTGAGGGDVAEAKGHINFGVGISGGFLLYCQKNIVGASYTANTGFPYIIKEVTGSAGVDSISDVGYQGNLPYQVAMTAAGFQQVSLDSAIPTLPEMSDFFTAKIFEDFDELSVSFSSEYLGGQMDIKISSISDRFIVISYGKLQRVYTHALIYDIALNRYGKLKLPHSSAFAYIAPAPSGFLTYAELMNTPIYSLGDTTYADFFTSLQLEVTPKQNLAFLQADGTVQLVDFSISEENANGVFIIGKFQFNRNNVFVHQKTEIESIRTSNYCAGWLLPSFDGKSFEAAQGTVINYQGPLTRTYAKRFTAQNISLCLIGAFNLTSMVLNFTRGGSR